MSLSAGMVTALAAADAILFHAVEIVLPGPVNIRLLDGTGSLTFSSKTFTGKDATYGVLGGIESIREELALEAPRCRVLLLPPTTAAVATLMAQANQGSAVNIWAGCVTRSTGAVVTSPELLFTGFYDTAKASAGKGRASVEIEVASDWERFFTAEEGARLNPSWHENIWPGEFGLRFIVDATRDPYWGTKNPEETQRVTGDSGSGLIGGALGINFG